MRSEDYRALIIALVTAVILCSGYLIMAKIYHVAELKINVKYEPKALFFDNSALGGTLYKNKPIESYFDFQGRFEKHFYENCNGNIDSSSKNYVKTLKIPGRAYLYEYQIVYIDKVIDEIEYSAEDLKTQVHCAVKKSSEDHSSMLLAIASENPVIASKVKNSEASPIIEIGAPHVSKLRQSKNLIHALILGLIAGIVVFTTISRTEKKLID